MVRRNSYYTYIEEKLQVLSKRIESRGKLNLLDLHIHAENFYYHFFNVLYGFNLKNMNQVLHNAEAIDLIDKTKKLAIQVSSTAKKSKVEGALRKKGMKNYSGYSFKFISISKDAKELRNQTYENPHGLSFDPKTDIYDVNSILSHILAMKAEDQKPIYEFIKSELGGEVEVAKIESNLASIIQKLSNEEWDESNKVDNLNAFEIDRKIAHNNLNKTKAIIQDYALFYTKLDSIYTEFDKLGSNRSNSVLAKVRREFTKVFCTADPDGSFQQTVDVLVAKVTESFNYDEIPIDELELCIEIIVVDAFIRCKVFENPNNYDYAPTR